MQYLNLCVLLKGDCKNEYIRVTAPLYQIDLEFSPITAEVIRNFFNAFLMHQQYIEYLANLSLVQLSRIKGVFQSKAKRVHSNLGEILTVLDYSVKNISQVVSIQ